MRVRSTGLPPAAGRILIAVPFYNDFFFNRTVVMLSDYAHEGSAGVILNKPTERNVQALCPDWRYADRLFFGGPVCTEEITLLHDCSFVESEEISVGVYAGFSPEILHLILEEEDCTINYRLYAGYAGWGRGQLMEEINKQMWVVAEPTLDLIWNTPPDMIWDSAVKMLGRHYAHWLQIPEDIHSN